MARTCPVCGAVVPVNIGPGRLRVYCSSACRRKAYQVRHALPAELAVPPSDCGRRLVHLGGGGLAVLQFEGCDPCGRVSEDAARLLALCEGTYMEWVGESIRVFGWSSCARPLRLRMGDCEVVVLCGDCRVEVSGERVGAAPNTIRDLDHVITGLLWQTRRTVQRREKQWV
nr:MAG TPA: protein of unknown function (DUF3330) [Caudoviricetes sp.]